MREGSPKRSRATGKAPEIDDSSRPTGSCSQWWARRRLVSTQAWHRQGLGSEGTGKEQDQTFIGLCRGEHEA